jgi:hypothetical protein
VRMYISCGACRIAYIAIREIMFEVSKDGKKQQR